MVVRKILETTIASGATTATFTDSDIPNSLIRVYSTNSNIYPQNISLSGNVLTVTYETLSSSMGVALEIVKQGLEIIDNLTSTDTDKALSANQGKSLKDSLDNVSNDLLTLSNTVEGLVIPDEITDLSDVDVTSIQDGQILAWNSLTEKFENITPIVSSGNDYSTTETEIGTWINGEKLYRRVIPITQDWAFVANTWVKSNIPVGNITLIENARVVVYYNDVYSLHFVQIGVVDGYIAGNCFRNFSAAANGSALVIEYTKS